MILRIDKDKLRVVTPDVGGGFGMKIFPFPEHIMTLLAAKTYGRPVKWTADRLEAFLADTHARDIHTHAQLGLDEEGRFVAFKLNNKANLGAYLSFFAPVIPTGAGGRVADGAYAIANVFMGVQGIFSTTAPVDAFRGAGRPECAYMIERTIDYAARKVGIDAAELRRRNFKHPGEGVTNWYGIPVDSGDFDKNLDDALSKSDWASRATRKETAKTAGRLRGLGLAYYVEITGGAPTEHAHVKFREDDTVDLFVGTQSNGQGHETAFAQLLSDRLGVPFDRISVRQGDTDELSVGGGTGGSRSLHLAGGAIDTASKNIIEKGRQVASHILEAAVSDIEFSTDGEAGEFRITGTDRRISLLEVAKAARNDDIVHEVGIQMDHGLDENGEYTSSNPTIPNGCHVCEVEIDPDTGSLSIQRYTVVDDFGFVLNPMLVEGQVQGGVAAGVGQAMIENIHYDEDSGQLVTGSLMDYAIVRADDLPNIDFHYNEFPTPSNPLGVKGCGEAGTVGSIPAFVNAVVDALEPYGVSHIDMPITPEKIWRAIHG